MKCRHAHTDSTADHRNCPRHDCGEQQLHYNDERIQHPSPSLRRDRNLEDHMDDKSEGNGDDGGSPRLELLLPIWCAWVSQRKSNDDDVERSRIESQEGLNDCLIIISKDHAEDHERSNNSTEKIQEWAWHLL